MSCFSDLISELRVLNFQKKIKQTRPCPNCTKVEKFEIWNWLLDIDYCEVSKIKHLKFGLYEKGTKFEKIFHFQFDFTQILYGIFFQILCLPQKVQNLTFAKVRIILQRTKYVKVIIPPYLTLKTVHVRGHSQTDKKTR